MIEKRTWQEFRDSGFLWWINRILHTFGWVITVEVADDGSILDVYPGRTRFRGFTESVEDKGFTQVNTFLRENPQTFAEKPGV